METTFPKTSNPGIKSTTKTLGGASTTDAATSDAAHGLVDRVTDGAHDTVDRVVAKAGPALDRARDAAGNLKTTAYTKWDDFINSEDKAESARSEIRDHPLTVVAIALVAGVIIGRL
ncbi:MAG: hypothetical protein ACXW13_01185 [Burkholderiaceae bacterium]